jgi:hypothetical protein
MGLKIVHFVTEICYKISAAKVRLLSLITDFQGQAVELVGYSRLNYWLPIADSTTGYPQQTQLLVAHSRLKYWLPIADSTTGSQKHLLV